MLRTDCITKLFFVVSVLFYCCCSFGCLDWVSLWSPRWPVTYYEVHVDFKHVSVLLPHPPKC